MKRLAWQVSRRLIVVVIALLAIAAVLTFHVLQNRDSSKTTSINPPPNQKPATDPLEVMHEEYSDQN